MIKDSETAVWLGLMTKPKVTPILLPHMKKMYGNCGGDENSDEKKFLFRMPGLMASVTPAMLLSKSLS